jgi:hypothetical protein
MAGKEISDLPVNSSPDGTELLYNRQSGTDKSMTLGQVDTFVNDEIDNKTVASLVNDTDNLLIRVASASKKVLARIFKDYILGGVNRVVGNASGNIPLSNGITNTNLRADNADNVGGIRPIEIEIGDWDMDITSSISVPSGLSPTILEKVRNISVIIRNDDNTILSDLIGKFALATGVSVGGSIDGILTSGNINLSRITGGVYDTSDYDSTPYNRGWILLWIAN